jgi:hypothetical protein
VVYRIARQSALNHRLVPGLYRWLLPGVPPDAVEPDKLEEKDGQLVIPGVMELKLSVLRAQGWSGSHSGPLPLGMKLSLTRSETRVEHAFSLPH